MEGKRQRTIIHVDMDAFFAAIEQRDNPFLRGKPVIIGADPKKGQGRGVVSTCSYEARKFGIHSAMPISLAYKRCPKAVFLPVDREKYCRVSQEVYEIFYNFTPKVEPISIDEAFLDITGSLHLFGSPYKLCLQLKSQIKKETGLTASVGCAPTKMAAKIASDLHKPDGFVIVTKDNLLSFLWPLDIEKIWGLGKKSVAIFKIRGIKTIGELAKVDPKLIIEEFGENGKHWWNLANGIDEREVETEEEIKSISKEVTFQSDTRDKQIIERALIRLSEEVSQRLRKENLKGKTLTLKIRLEGFHTYTRSMTLIKTTNFVDTIYKGVKKLFDNFNLQNKKVRLLGVKMSNCISSQIHDSLIRENNELQKEEIHKAVDKIREKFGKKAICRAAGLKTKRRSDTVNYYSQIRLR